MWNNPNYNLLVRKCLLAQCSTTLTFDGECAKIWYLDLSVAPSSIVRFGYTYLLSYPFRTAKSSDTETKPPPDAPVPGRAGCLWQVRALLALTCFRVGIADRVSLFRLWGGVP